MAGVCFTWLGMVLAISFLEAPLKFRAPGITIPLGLGIGRLVFRALNAAELVLAAGAVVAAVVSDPPTTAAVTLAVVIVVLVVQLAVVRPVLNRRSDRIVAGEALPAAHVHIAYIALEIVKVAALLATGIVTLAS
jgi:hypothetical protein